VRANEPRLEAGPANASSRRLAYLLARSAANPREALAVGWALLKGHWYKFYYRTRGARFSAGTNFRVYGRLVVRGPGKVVFGDNVRITRLATPWTYTAEARIIVGDNVVMESVRFGCVREILIGQDCMLAGVHIMDTNFHSTRADRHSPSAPVFVGPVHVRENVWIGGRVAILPATSIGANSVVGFGAVCRGKFPANVIILGNPAEVFARIPPAEGSERTEPGREPTPVP
jgi:acetyltransferase-like isoleucine patch superfamily enzyme